MQDGFTFIDLFCGIGGFHLAMKDLGGRCVLACDIDAKCRQVYADNFGIQPQDDVTRLDTASIPDFDVLCAGFPCQAFSHAGRQAGFEDTRGTLFMDIVRILLAKKPKYFLLENVKNLRTHDSGRTWKVIYANLIQAGYFTYETPFVLSPCDIGVPQNRERVFITGVRNDLLQGTTPPPFVAPVPTHHTTIDDILTETDDPSLMLSAQEIELLNHWETFIQHFKQAGIKLPTFPIWTDEFDAATSLDDLPAWKSKFIRQNRAFYEEHRPFLRSWLQTARTVAGFTGSKRKLEWQCGEFQASDSLWTLLFQFRPSGIRVKRATYSPALVAMAQIVVVGRKKRILSPLEVARLQSFPDSFKRHSNANTCYKQFGNSVNVEVIKAVARHLFTRMVPVP